MEDKLLFNLEKRGLTCFPADVKHLLNLYDKLIINLNKQIKTLPDNHNINRISENCFTVNIKEVGRNNTILCPLYYNFRKQYQIIIEMINNSNINSIMNNLFYVIRHGKHPNKKNIRFHPKVVEYIKKIIK